MITKEIQLSESLANNDSMVKLVMNVSRETTRLEEHLRVLKNLLERDTNLIESLKREVGQELRNSDLANRSIEQLKSSGHAKYPNPNYDPYATYFTTFANALEKRMQQYRQTIEELETSIKNTFSQSEYTPDVLLEIMKAQDSSFLAIAGKIAALDDKISEHRKWFYEYLRKYFGDDGRGIAAEIGDGQKTGGEESSLAELAAKTLQPSVPQQGQQQQGTPSWGSAFSQQGQQQPTAATPSWGSAFSQQGQQQGMSGTPSWASAFSQQGQQQATPGASAWAK
ncbi:Nucleoporin p58/p45 [Borealophlyctis nickersoniae]|nr:Nucleoporin p58/p45 [Borealophlyctis nickersoniae]